jgi:hypothetical protein
MLGSSRKSCSKDFLTDSVSELYGQKMYEGATSSTYYYYVTTANSIYRSLEFFNI